MSARYGLFLCHRDRSEAICSFFTKDNLLP
jgi:hypothetical protein